MILDCRICHVLSCLLRIPCILCFQLLTRVTFVCSPVRCHSAAVSCVLPYFRLLTVESYSIGLRNARLIVYRIVHTKSLSFLDRRFTVAIPGKGSGLRQAVFPIATKFCQTVQANSHY